MERALLEGIEERGGAGRVGGRRAFGVVDTAPREDRRDESTGELSATRHAGRISPQPPRAVHRCFAHRWPAVGQGLEAVPGAELYTPRAGGDAGRTILRRVRIAASPATKVLIVEYVEYLECQVHFLCAERGHWSTEPHIHVAKRPSVREDEARLGREGSVFWAPDLERNSRTQGEQAAELDSERHVYDPIPDDAVALHAGCRIVRVVGREPVRETEQVSPILSALGPGIRKSRAPVRSLGVPSLRLQVDGVVPRLDRVARQKHLPREPRRWRIKAVDRLGACRRAKGVVAHVCESVVAPYAGVGRGDGIMAYQPPHAKAPLLGFRGLGVVGYQLDLGQPRLTAGQQPREALLAQVGIVPPHLAHGGISRVLEEEKIVVGMLCIVLLDDRDVVVQVAVVVHPETAEHSPASPLI